MNNRLAGTKGEGASESALVARAASDYSPAPHARAVPALSVHGLHFYEDDRKWVARGVTYGPFRPREDGQQFPATEVMGNDLDDMVESGINVLRLYTAPSPDLIEETARRGLRILVDVPWPKHLEVYSSRELIDLSLKTLRDSIGALDGATNLMGVILGNEIPADVVRWTGRRKVEKFLRRLYREAKKLIPDTPVGFANYPSTEYLDISFFDFIGFNVYLEEQAALRSYLTRLRRLYPETPLVMTETGADSIAHGEENQAHLIEMGLSTAFELGFAGGFAFAWTDEWHTGGYDINDWKFGLVDRQRRPKAALLALRHVYAHAPQQPAAGHQPGFSVVVATYNGGATLRQCLEALLAQDYPRHEIIVVDDGSTDDETGPILEDFADRVRIVRQENRGLSVARNAGIEAAREEIVAFTDSDCFPDRDWLHHLSLAFDGDWAGAGGPNLTPFEENLSHRCVAYAPGHATHVLLSEEEAEHVPGCNMAFRRDALLAVGCFDPQFRKAGDDVDVIWRMQEAGMRIRFVPGAFVWHHRRSSPSDYWKQQKGYGEAEALLARKHPLRFNDRGQSRWSGVVYSRPESASLFKSPNIHYGVFASAGYQCIYDRPESGFVYFASSLEWWLLAGAAALTGVVTPLGWQIALLMALFSVFISISKAQRRLREKGGLPKRAYPLVWWLWIGQPLVRAWARYRGRAGRRGVTREFVKLRRETPGPELRRHNSRAVLEFWAEEGDKYRIQVLQEAVEKMRRLGWLFSAGAGWDRWDLHVTLSWLWRVAIRTIEEDHGAGKRLLRVRTRLVPTTPALLAATGWLALSGLVWTQESVAARVLLAGGLVVGWLLYREARMRVALVRKVLADTAVAAGYMNLLGREDEERVKRLETFREESETIL